MSSTGTQQVFTFEQIGGRIQRLRRLVDRDDKNWSAFNASIGFSPKHGYAVTFRSSNYVILDHGELHVVTGGPIRNHVWFAEIYADSGLEAEAEAEAAAEGEKGEQWVLDNLRKITFSERCPKFIRGVEDAKLLWRDDRWMFTAVAMEKEIPVARHCECYLNEDATEVEDVIVYPGVDARRPEKNWMTAGNKPTNFEYVYGANAIVQNGVVVHRLRDIDELSALRGNTHLLEQADGTYIAVMHRLMINKRPVYDARRFSHVEGVDKIYNHYFVRVDSDGWVIEVSQPFYFMHRGIEFAAGIVETESEYVISFGKEDVSSHLAFIDKNIVQKGLKPIGRS